MPFNGAVYLRVSIDGQQDYQLWRTDGTEVGTTLVADIDLQSSTRGVGYEAVFGGRLYFGADDGTSGYELWSTDGTPGGTARVADINAGPSGSGPGSSGSLTISFRLQ